MIAYAYANGVIEYGAKCPKGALPIAKHEDEGRLREVIEVKARKAWQDGVWLVPGVPEAGDQGEAVDALLAFGRLVKEALDSQ